MIRRAIRIAIGARATWFIAAIAALVVSHSFVLACDLFAAASRTALSGQLMFREMDPLAAVVRPTLGALILVTALLVPILASRPLAIERERNTLEALTLRTGSFVRVAWVEAIAGVCAALVVVVPLPFLFLWFSVVGHLDAIETGVALFGTLLHIVWIATLAVAAAAWTRTHAQAIAAALGVSLFVWGIEVGLDVAALSWLSNLETLSVAERLAPFHQGIISLASIAFFVVGIVGAVALTVAGLARRKLVGLAVAFGTVVALVISTSIGGAWDWSEERRQSLPPAIADAVRSIPSPITVEVYLDRDDATRRHLESLVLGRIRLARHDATIVFPLDRSGAVLDRDSGYGRVVAHVGARSCETRSMNRREITGCIFEAAERVMPPWEQTPYPGYPCVPRARWFLVTLAYGVIPIALILVALTRARRRGRSS